MDQETFDKIKETKKSLEKSFDTALFLLMSDFIERQRKELKINSNVQIFLTAEKMGDGVDVHIEDNNNYPKFVKTINIDFKNP